LKILVTDQLKRQIWDPGNSARRTGAFCAALEGLGRNIGRYTRVINQCLQARGWTVLDAELLTGWARPVSHEGTEANDQMIPSSREW
jgi:hypothetical protein